MFSFIKINKVVSEKELNVIIFKEIKKEHLLNVLNFLRHYSDYLEQRNKLN